MIKPKVIGIHSQGWGVGKDTVAKIIAKHIEGSCYRLAFADPAKRYVQDLTGEQMECSFDEFENPYRDFTREQKAKYIPMLHMTIGEFLQGHCQGLREDISPRIYVNAWDKDFLKLDGLVVAPDVRYITEADHIIDRDGIILNLSGPCRSDDSRDSSHISENNMNDYTDFSAHIINDSSESNLEKKVVKFLKGFGLV